VGFIWDCAWLCAGIPSKQEAVKRMTLTQKLNCLVPAALLSALLQRTTAHPHPHAQIERLRQLYMDVEDKIEVTGGTWVQQAGSAAFAACQTQPSMLHCNAPALGLFAQYQFRLGMSSLQTLSLTTPLTPIDPPARPSTHPGCGVNSARQSGDAGWSC
jgi:hypothetical protein